MKKKTALFKECHVPTLLTGPEMFFQKPSSLRTELILLN